MKKHTGLTCVIILLIGSTACNTQPVLTTGDVSVAKTATPELGVSPTPLSRPTATPETMLVPTISPETTITPITDFDSVAAVFESQELGITVRYPLGWTVKQNLQSGSIAVADNWTAFTKGDANADAIGLLILSMPDSSESAKKTLENLVPKMNNIDKQIGDIVLEEHKGQEFAWGEYGAKSLGDNAPVNYFLTAISNGKKHVTVFASVNADRQEEVRSIYHAIVERIELH
jgi:hypothetical protein